MEWTVDAEKLIKKVPFFVRNRVKARVEKETRAAGKSVVDAPDVRAAQQQFLKTMSSEVKGYQIDACFGESGCPHQAMPAHRLIPKLEHLLKKADLRGFLKDHVKGDLKFHHEFRITLADCPNACSQPQIKDVGIIGAVRPSLTDRECSLCGACVDVCKEQAIQLPAAAAVPVIDPERCLLCGQCIPVCPTGTLDAGEHGYRVMIGGKLGRHPRLAAELPGMVSESETLAIVERCLTLYKTRSTGGRRFAAILREEDLSTIAGDK